MKDIVSVGEILIDLTFVEKNNGVPIFKANPGGAPANVSVAASKLGAKTAFIGKVGKDYYGDFLKETLQENNVDIRGVKTDESARTTLAIVAISDTGERSFAFYRRNCADVLLENDEINLDLVNNTHFLHFGSVSLTDEPSRSATVYAVKKAKESGATITYDPNYRSNLWESERDAVETMKSVLKYVDILKISEEELPLIAGTSDYELGTKIISEKYGISLVLLTLGPDGAFFRRGNDTGKVDTFNEIKVADTNGAGDTFFGAFLSCMCSLEIYDPAKLASSQINDSVRTANLAASLTTSRSGAIPAMPDKNELTQWLEKEAK